MNTLTAAAIFRKLDKKRQVDFFYRVSPLTFFVQLILIS